MLDSMTAFFVQTAHNILTFLVPLMKYQRIFSWIKTQAQLHTSFFIGWGAFSLIKF